MGASAEPRADAVHGDDPGPAHRSGDNRQGQPHVEALRKKQNGHSSDERTVNAPREELKPPKFIPFHQWIEERQAKYSHQPWNIDPPTYNYKPKFFDSSKVAKKKDLPENAHVNMQKF